ncbi:hypothetical protein ABVK25_004724 [Lepraria finkii]|uniref:Uncharacterized protein n=1 Tax=Lepraria finkii TaxID=1340010 RepID=A0ABR4BBU8_9LECA
MKILILRTTDNPKRYDSEAQKVDERLRGPVLPIELKIDNAKMGITTSSAHIRGQLKDEIVRGPQPEGDDQTKYDPMRHLGGALHCLEDAGVVTTAAGPAPPLITGSFGPLDLYESLLGELDDQVVSGTLNELDITIGSDSSSLTSDIDVVKLALKGAEFARAKAPPIIYSQLEGLKSSGGGTGTNQIR